jgi:hypothetical protein
LGVLHGYADHFPEQPSLVFAVIVVRTETILRQLMWIDDGLFAICWKAAAALPSPFQPFHGVSQSSSRKPGILWKFAVL